MDIEDRKLKMTPGRPSFLPFIQFGSRYSALAVVILMILLLSPLFAQDETEKIPKGIVPPPLNLITKKEHAGLDAQRSTKKRTKLAIKLIEARLANSEENLGKQEFREALNELGRFQALIRNTFGFLKDKGGRKGSLRDYKRLELALRRFLPRLEILRREMPFRYAYHVRNLIKFVRKARTEALEPLFDDSVVPQKAN